MTAGGSGDAVTVDVGSSEDVTAVGGIEVGVVVEGANSNDISGRMAVAVHLCRLSARGRRNVIRQAWQVEFRPGIVAVLDITNQSLMEVAHRPTDGASWPISGDIGQAVLGLIPRVFMA